ncbi:MAG: Eco29kI family restriction endonuclease [Armatimonadetes bacterium]|nr:Eco29kI family restriction endonuclease [Armatimonadota bacterium]
MAQHPIALIDFDFLAENVARHLTAAALSPLPPPSRFAGNGLYALYYCGEFADYAPVASPDCTTPIYVGKAIKARGRGEDVYGRLQEHAESTRHADNLRLEDFRCRYLVVEPVWVVLGEHLLLMRYHPLWNDVVKGFGIHDPGRAGRGTQRRSRWDTLHPGRRFAEGRPPNNKTEEQIRALIAAHFRQYPPG